MTGAHEWDQEMERLRGEFVLEAQARLAHARALVARLPEPESPALVDELRGVFHSLAGTGGSFGFPEVSALALEGEKLCHRARPDRRPLSDAEIDACRSLLDALAVRLEAPAGAAPGDIETGLHAAQTTPPDSAVDVLVVEHDNALAAKLAGLLQQEGHQVRRALTLAQALDCVDQRRPDALVVNVRLPDGVAYPFVEQLRTQPGGDRLPVVAVTGLDALPDRVEAVRCGIDAFFTTPVDAGAVVQRVRFLLQRTRTAPGRVLSVDDDPQQAAYLRTVLESAGYVFRWCGDPAAMEAEVASFHPHLVLMDVLFSGVSGFDLVRVLRQDQRHAVLPIVFLTTEARMQDRMRAMTSGADEFLAKPVAAPLLLTTVATRIERARLLESLLVRDGLTGLLTHGAFLERAQGVVAAHHRRTRPAAAFLMLDVDHFKSINDRHGHGTGDRVLAALGALLRRRLRQSDLIGRYGGDEFAAIVEEIDGAETARLAERLLLEFSETTHATPAGTPLRVTFSVGVAPLEPGMSLADWSEAADRRLYAAKAAARASVVAEG